MMKLPACIKWYVFFLSLILTVYACKKPYYPEVNAPNAGYLVVEGNISNGDSTIITLSRTLPLNDTTSVKPETGANVSIEDNAGNSYSLKSGAAGKHYTLPLALDASKTYRLHIVTSDNNTYLSDFVPVKDAPAIDSVGYTVQNGGVQLYVNAHDAQNNTRYYRWQFAETWKFHALYPSQFKSDGTEIIPRPFDQQIYTCFGQSNSTEVVLGSSAKLAQDVIYQQPVQFVSSTSEKLETRYSILVRQYALTADAYNFWSILMKDTQNLGTIFDAQPSELQGNIHNTTNPKQLAVGYISCGRPQTKRIYINASSLPSSWTATYPYQCELTQYWYKNPFTMQNDVAEFLVPLPPLYLPVASFGNGGIDGYTGAVTECADCTIRGKVSPPSFWQDN